MQDSNLTSGDMSLAVLIAMTLNQFLTNALPGLVVALLLVYTTGEGWAALAWGAAIWIVYSLGSIAALSILLPRE